MMQRPLLGLIVIVQNAIDLFLQELKGAFSLITVGSLLPFLVDAQDSGVKVSHYFLEHSSVDLLLNCGG
jgi:hypothetical protein